MRDGCPIAASAERLGLAATSLDALSPLAVLQRGYAMPRMLQGPFSATLNRWRLVMKCAFVWRKEDSMRASKVSRGPMSFSNDMK